MTLGEMKAYQQKTPQTELDLGTEVILATMKDAEKRELYIALYRGLRDKGFNEADAVSYMRVLVGMDKGN